LIKWVPLSINLKKILIIINIHKSIILIKLLNKIKINIYKITRNHNNFSNLNLMFQLFLCNINSLNNNINNLINKININIHNNYNINNKILTINLIYNQLIKIKVIINNRRNKE
jgi:hypothetical protein